MYSTQVTNAASSFRRRAIVLAAGALACCGGCGPLGAYNAAHSYLSSHHVFKPVLPDVFTEPPIEAKPEKQIARTNSEAIR